MLEILLEEKARRPETEARDFCKLLYQSEFGGGHLPGDAAVQLARLREECAVCGAGNDVPFERVGGGLLRLNLRALPALKLRKETVCGLFACACAPRGSVTGLEKKLDILRANAARLELDEETVAREVDAWRAAGYPALSHSGVYRALYHPAYRLVPEATGRFLALFQAIDALLERKGRARVAIDGNSGAGKSTLGALLAAVYGGNLYHMDDFFLPPERKTTARLAEPGGNVDWERFRDEVLSRLGAPFSYRPWRCHAEALDAPVAASTACIPPCATPTTCGCSWRLSPRPNGSAFASAAARRCCGAFRRSGFLWKTPISRAWACGNVANWYSKRRAYGGVCALRVKSHCRSACAASLTHKHQRSECGREVFLWR